MAAFRLFRMVFGANHMTSTDASVLLNYAWLVVALFGPSLPMLNILIALLVKIYSVLLFASGSCDVDMRLGRSIRTSGSGFNVIALLAVALQSSSFPSEL
eukprot:5809643-Amphidinium_carterae.1